MVIWLIILGPVERVHKAEDASHIIMVRKQREEAEGLSVSVFSDWHAPRELVSHWAHPLKSSSTSKQELRGQSFNMWALGARNPNCNNGDSRLFLMFCYYTNASRTCNVLASFHTFANAPAG